MEPHKAGIEFRAGRSVHGSVYEFVKLDLMEAKLEGEARTLSYLAQGLRCR
jgi:hypothetical protein